MMTLGNLPPWLQYAMMGTGDEVISPPRTSYGSPRLPQNIPTESGPRAGMQRATPEGYKTGMPRKGVYTDKDVGIRQMLGPALPPLVNVPYTIE